MRRETLFFYKRDGKNMWLGPARVVAQDGKVVFIRHGSYLIRVAPNRLYKCIPNCEEKEKSEEISASEELTECHNDLRQTEEENNIGHSQSIVETIENDSQGLERLENTELSESEAVEVPRRSLRLMNKEHGWNVHDVFTVQVPKHQQDDPMCLNAKQEELQKLKNFNVFNEIQYTGQECISTRWVLTKKGKEYRARLVAKGFQEQEEIRTDSPTVGKSITRIAFAIATSNHWNLESTDVKSAFLQSDTIQRDVFLIPPKEAQTAGNIIWKLNKCLYGLSDAARQFYMSVKYELKRLGCQQSFLDKTVFYKQDAQGLCGLILTHVDDFLHCGSSTFEKSVLIPLCQRFKVGERAMKDFKYVGLHITQEENNISVNQIKYAESIEPPDMIKSSEGLSGKEQTDFRALSGALQWLSNGTRPDLAFDTLLLSCKMKEASRQDMLNCLKTIKRAKLEEVKMKFPDLGKISRLVIYSDASFANLPDNVSSCMGYVILLVEDNKNRNTEHKCCLVAWKSNKIKRVCRSTLAAETMALTEAIEESLYLKSFLDELGFTVSIEAYTDNLGLREAVYSTKQVDDKQTRIDIAALQQMLQEKKVNQINWCSSDNQLANVLTKKGASARTLLEAICSGRLTL